MKILYLIIFIMFIFLLRNMNYSFLTSITPYFIKSLSNLKLYWVISASMEPHIKKGSFVLVLTSSEYKLHDVITYRYQNLKNSLITHRIVQIKKYSMGKLYITKGDANKYPDNVPVSQEEIIGKVLFCLPCPLTKI